MLDRYFDGCYRDASVLLTGATGFKGAWLAHWLCSLGARVHDVSLAPPTDPNLFDLADLGSQIHHRTADIRDPDVLPRALEDAKPRFIFHLAAQSLVRESYRSPLETFETNVMGTARLLDALRASGQGCTLVVITTDKCYENATAELPHEEDDPLGGHDPYSASKSCAELVVTAYRRSFFDPSRLGEHGVSLATARAGNVIGPGDWATDRLVPDAVRALAAGAPLEVRNPASVRPWQHVLEPLAGYLWLGAKLAGDQSGRYCEAWNFGPDPAVSRTVREVAAAFEPGDAPTTRLAGGVADEPYESECLRLSIAKAREQLGWWPLWSFEEMLSRTAHGYRRLQREARTPAAVRQLLSEECDAYQEVGRQAGLPWAGASA